MTEPTNEPKTEPQPSAADLTTEEVRPAGLRAAAPETELVLVVAWDADGLGRAGQVLRLSPPGGPAGLFGRGDGPVEPGEVRLPLVQQRPGAQRLCAPLASRHLSRRQLRLCRLERERATVENLGRLPLRVGGRVTAQGTIGPGDLVELEGQLLLLACARPSPWPAARSVLAPDATPFGAPDADGLVGESPAAWTLRDAIAFAAPRDGHVLVVGPAGSGKELTVRAVHRQGPQASRPLVIRNAATLPAAHLEAELFGHAAGFPDPGAPERPGLVGQASGGALFLDGVDALDEAGQATLLRLLDGDYQRLGDPRTRRADLRVLATAASPEALRPELLQRFRHVLRVPPLAQRREDVPLLVRHLLQRALDGDASLAARFLAPGQGPRVDAGLVETLLEAADRLEVRALEQLLWACLAASPGDTVELPPQLEGRLEGEPDDPPRSAEAPAAAPAEPPAPGAEPEPLRAALETLTPAERTVLLHLSRNLTSREIARALFVSTRTVQNHRQRICTKLGLRGANALLEVALRLGPSAFPGEQG